MAIFYCNDKNPDGSLLGHSSTDKIGFYGLTTPIARATVTPAVSTATTATNEAAIVRITAALVNLGLIATA